MARREVRWGNYCVEQNERGKVSKQANKDSSVCFMSKVLQGYVCMVCVSHHFDESVLHAELKVTVIVLDVERVIWVRVLHYTVQTCTQICTKNAITRCMFVVICAINTPWCNLVYTSPLLWPHSCFFDICFLIADKHRRQAYFQEISRITPTLRRHQPCEECRPS